MINIGIDKVVERLKGVLYPIQFQYRNEDCNIESVDLFDANSIFGIAEYDERTGEPIQYYDAEEFLNLASDDRMRIKAFVYEHDYRKLDSGKAFYQISLVVWFNHYLLVPNAKPQRRLREFLLHYILQALKNDLQFSYNERGFEIYTDKRNIYRDFKIDFTKPLMKHPYDGFRIKFSYIDNDDCGFEDLLIDLCI